ncbi:ABC transporter substrate-binding protein [Noviherbaspirillum sedimenti]|uniref:ABC transporter substrate-binding protein n=1 Tax=Noviherbaspirillum sedimenti TaxID=2320865 RepID=A0A3A3FZ89_9BURK|nr:ABC transporter substrate-binding protein [Noviherbaspirillum sedimenti]RJG00675.1 ABC transporter substrate-binding protein [Noviherbaspirillum sedimenti]
MLRAPYRISIYHNWAIQLQLLLDWEDAARLAFEEAFEAGIIDRPVELVSREVWGAPNGSALEVGAAMRDIVANDRVHAMIGLAMTEDCAVLRQEINEKMKIPVLTFAATTGFDGEYCFSAPCGTFMDEAPVIAAFIKSQGFERFAMIHDTSFQGEEYGEALRASARHANLEIACCESINSVAPEAEVIEKLQLAKAAGVEAFAYVGVGMQFKQLAAAFRKLDWNPKLRMTGLTFCGANPGFDGPTQYEGWYGLDQYHEGNETLMKMAVAFQKRFGRDGSHMWAAHGYDEGRVMALALGNASPPSRAGIRAAMEKIRMLPAAVGCPGNHISYGPYDHRGYKGDYFTIRRINEGRNELVGVPSQFLASL